MRVRLMHRDRDVDLERPLPDGADALVQDLGLDALVGVMSRGDGYLRTAAERALLLGVSAPEEVAYRTEALADCLERRDVVRRLYEIAVDGVDAKQRARFFWFGESAESQLGKSLAMLELFAQTLRDLRAVADEHATAFRSAGFARFFDGILRELDDPYLAELDEHRKALELKGGITLDVSLGPANRGTDYVLRRPGHGLLGRLTPDLPGSLSFGVSPRDEHGMRALADLRGRGLARAANALAQSVDHILSFFQLLRAEVGFYVVCLNLEERLAELGAPVCLPEPAAVGAWALSADGLYDPALALQLGSRPVGNTVRADGKRLLLVTGANEGGKSTFLRSVGTAQLLLQAGMFVPAERFRASVPSGVFTHFKREEDGTMSSGKLDEELQRMSDIVEHVRPGALVLCNESLASTNEAEGSEIARQVVAAFVDEDVRVVFVTHMYELAHGLSEQRLETTLCLRAERRADGVRTFRIVPGEPEPTSYGADSFGRIFGGEPLRSAG